MRALILGNGPSIDLLNPDDLDKFNIVIGTNHIYKKFKIWGRNCDVIVITDHNRLSEIVENEIPKGIELYIGDERRHEPSHHFTKKYISRDFIALKQKMRKKLDVFPFNKVNIPESAYKVFFDKERFGFLKGEDLNYGNSVVISAIQIAIQKGYKEIYLWGVDANYKKEYFDDAKDVVKYRNSNFMNNARLMMEPILVSMQIQCEYLNVVIRDLTPNGSLRNIEKMSIKDISTL